MNTNSNTPQTQAPRGSQFFNWIRSSYVIRPNNRVVAGVAAAIADQLGWSVVLVRVLFVVVTLFGGFGLFLYGLGWLLLPDEYVNGQILAEDAINGAWDWATLGPIVCFVLAFGSGSGSFWWFGGTHIMGLLFAGLALYLLIDNGRRRFAQPGGPQAGGQMGGQPGGPVGPGGPAGPGGTNGPAGPGGPYYGGPQTGAPSSNAYAQQHYGAQQGVNDANGFNGVPNSQQYSQAQQFPQDGPGQQRGSFNASGNQGNQYAGGSFNVPPQPYPTGPAYVQPAVSRRRKPAGPALVLMMVAIGFLVTAALMFFEDHSSGLSAQMFAVELWAAIPAVILGITLIVLGIRGRRAGGLIPFAWISMVVCCAVMVTGGTYAVLNNNGWWKFSNVEHTMNVSGQQTVNVNENLLTQLEQGYGIVGDDYSKDIVNLVMTRSSVNKSHRVTMMNDVTTTSTCPTGTIQLTVVQAQAVITLPKGCTFEFDGYDSEAGEVVSAVGGADVVAINSIGLQIVTSQNDGVNMALGGSSWSNTWSDQDLVTEYNAGVDCSAVTDDDYDGYDYSTDDRSQWPCYAYEDATPEPELVIETPVLVNGSVTVQYQ